MLQQRMKHKMQCFIVSPLDLYPNAHKDLKAMCYIFLKLSAYLKTLRIFENTCEK